MLCLQQNLPAMNSKEIHPGMPHFSRMRRFRAISSKQCLLCFPPMMDFHRQQLRPGSDQSWWQLQSSAFVLFCSFSVCLLFPSSRKWVIVPRKEVYWACTGKIICHLANTIYIYIVNVVRDCRYIFLWCHLVWNVFTEFSSNHNTFSLVNPAGLFCTKSFL